MCRILELEALEDYARRLRIGRRQMGDRAIVDAPARTPTKESIGNWLRADESGGDVMRLRRSMNSAGSVTPPVMTKTLELLGWGNSEACKRFGTSYPGVIDAWRDGTIPIPPYVASHLRTLVDALAGNVRLRVGGG